MVEGVDEAEEEEQEERKVIGLWTLFKKLHWLASAVFLCFCITMVFPVFTAVSDSTPLWCLCANYH